MLTELRVQARVSAAVSGCLVLLAGLVLTGAVRAADPLAAETRDTDLDPVELAAARLDAVLDGLRGAPAEPVDDATFARRAYLDIVGRIPDLTELRAFLDDRSAHKRDALVDALLASPGQRSHAANAWADLLRLRDTLSRRVSGAPLQHWIREHLERGTAYDVMVRELLVAEGSAHARDNGATGHLLRDQGMLEDSMANTVRAFLGARVECAQCHDHPYESWTQEQYHAMVAFTGGMDYKLPLIELPNGGDVVELHSAFVEEHGRTGKRVWRKTAKPLLAGIHGTGTGLVEMPEDALWLAGEPVRARTLFGETVQGPEPRGSKASKGGKFGKRGKPKGKRARDEVEAAPAAPSWETGEFEAPRGKLLDVGSREVFADWVVSNPEGLFARTMANRAWSRLMGRGVSEPLDELLTGETRSPELLAELERLLLDVDYDLRAFQRVVLHTRAWRAEALPSTHEHAGLTAPGLRRLSAEQVWDSLLTLVVPDLDATLGPALTERAAEVYDEYEAAVSDPSVLAGRLADGLLKDRDKAAFKQLESERKSAAKAEGRAERDELRAAAKPLERALRKAERKGQDERAAELRDELTALGVDQARAEKRDLLRASELEQPAPADHLLARYGQSDREQLDNGHREDSIPQVFALLNGFVEEELLAHDGAVLVRAVREADDADARLDAAWLSVLGRLPTARERDAWRDDVRADPDAACRDLIWCLVNSHEFLFER